MSFPNLQRHADEIRSQGYTIIPDVLAADEIRAINDVVDSIFEQEKEIGPKRDWHNNIYRVAYMLPQKHEMFRTLPFNPRLLPLMQQVLGQRCVLSSLNALTMSPGGVNQKLHRDHGDLTPGVAMTINALHTLDAFTRENGATRVIPGSQDRSDLPAEPKDMESLAVYLEAPAGSVIAFNGALIHAGSANTTTQLRRCLHAYYARPWVRPQWDYPSSLSPEVIATLSAEQKRFMGFYPPSLRYDYVEHRMIKNVPPAES